MTTLAIYPGTFDPITHGHVDIAARAAKLFDRVIFAVAGNQVKQPLLELTERLALAQQVLQPYSNVEVDSFDCLAVDYIRQQQAQVVIRGVRTASDLEYEMQLANMSRQVAPDLDIIFMPPAERYQHVSSSLVREFAYYGSDLSTFVPDAVAKALQQRMAKKHKG